MTTTLNRRALAAGLFALIPAPAVAVAETVEVDPIYDAIDAARATNKAFCASFEGLDEDNTEAMARADALGDLATDALATLAAIRPTTLAGLFALIRYYAEDAEASEPWTVGTYNLDRLVRVLPSHSGGLAR